MKDSHKKPIPTPESIWAILQETVQLQKENEQKFEQETKELREQIGYIGESQGSFAEEYFYNSFERGEKYFFGKKFDAVARNLSLSVGGVNGECDIVLYNTDTIAIVEVKFKVRKRNIKELIQKVELFKIQFPCYKDFKIYLALASLIFPDPVRHKCTEEGIAVIKQVGNTVVIIDDGLKAY
jgi:hypothetical protein